MKIIISIAFLIIVTNSHGGGTFLPQGTGAPPEYLIKRSPQSINLPCPKSNYDIAWALNLGTGELLDQVVSGNLKFKPWCDGQEGEYQFKNAYTGGFISNSADVDPSVIIGPKASVCDDAKIKGQVKICGRVEIRGDIVLEGNIYIDGKGVISPRR